MARLCGFSEYNVHCWGPHLLLMHMFCSMKGLNCLYRLQMSIWRGLNIPDTYSYSRKWPRYVASAVKMKMRAQSGCRMLPFINIKYIHIQIKWVDLVCQDCQPFEQDIMYMLTRESRYRIQVHVLLDRD